MNHFAIACKYKGINELEDTIVSENETTESDNDFRLESIICQVRNNSEWRETVLVNNTKIAFKVDTGAEVNILPISKFKELDYNESLKKTNRGLKSYTGHNLKVIGTCQLKCIYPYI